MTEARKLATEITQHLPGWEVVPAKEGESDWADLVRPTDGARIRVKVGGWRMEGRIAFYGCWPRYADGSQHWNGKTVEITCAANREPKTLAKEVLRRFLPAYEPLFAEAAAYVRAHDAAAIEARMVAERIAQAIGAKVGEDRSRRGDGVGIVEEPENVRRLVVHPAYTGLEDRPCCVDFHAINLDPMVAMQVLSIIRDAEDRKKEAVRARVGEPLRVAVTRNVTPEPSEEEDERDGRASTEPAKSRLAM